ncbi:uncharacterized protein SPPG_07338 [Spizellomyces punctatus DAOM BR117]|uniref:Uncharacterized protein n=1 Tax=Spizellomyces punctatus (strain DAOM BR117) TaxID=645134 RepID=A0A0L0H8Z7_SPIPD|nr:uncharacterized protein SPPG_07338 [Spizellomyces punctatus DAOM BR117]KNC97414.1 hypothetical protein SPPG_07338 [Spizellomyces punctatus DAOM BR117]|eukprot:XP_016605454.1 hypothetical protein SPPG_07338 [Spizellomyces punctatus DAOM BR117]
MLPCAQNDAPATKLEEGVATIKTSQLAIAKFPTEGSSIPTLTRPENCSSLTRSLLKKKLKLNPFSNETALGTILRGSTSAGGGTTMTTTTGPPSFVPWGPSISGIGLCLAKVGLSAILLSIPITIVIVCAWIGKVYHFDRSEEQQRRRAQLLWAGWAWWLPRNLSPTLLTGLALLGQPSPWRVRIITTVVFFSGELLIFWGFGTYVTNVPVAVSLIMFPVGTICAGYFIAFNAHLRNLPMRVRIPRALLECVSYTFFAAASWLLFCGATYLAGSATSSIGSQALNVIFNGLIYPIVRHILLHGYVAFTPALGTYLDQAPENMMYLRHLGYDAHYSVVGLMNMLRGPSKISFFLATIADGGLEMIWRTLEAERRRRWIAGLWSASGEHAVKERIVEEESEHVQKVLSTNMEEEDKRSVDASPQRASKSQSRKSRHSVQSQQSVPASPVILQSQLSTANIWWARERISRMVADALARLSALVATICFSTVSSHPYQPNISTDAVCDLKRGGIIHLGCCILEERLVKGVAYGDCVRMGVPRLRAGIAFSIILLVMVSSVAPFLAVRAGLFAGENGCAGDVWI